MQIIHIQSCACSLEINALVIKLIMLVISLANCLTHHVGADPPPLIVESNKLSGLILSAGQSIQNEVKQNEQEPRIFLFLSQRPPEGLMASRTRPAPSSDETPPVDPRPQKKAPANATGIKKIDSVISQRLQTIIKCNPKAAPAKQLEEKISDTNSTLVDNKPDESVMSWLNQHFGIVPQPLCIHDCTNQTNKLINITEPIGTGGVQSVNKSITSKRSDSRSAKSIKQPTGLDNRPTDTTAAVLNEIRNDEKSERLGAGSKIKYLVKKHHPSILSDLAGKKLIESHKEDKRSQMNSSPRAGAAKLSGAEEKLIASTFAVNHFSHPQAPQADITNWKNMSQDRFAHLLSRFNFAINSTQFHDVEDLYKAKHRLDMKFMHFG